MSQPNDQYATMKPLGDQREELGEFFLANPWQQDNHNLSAYERNRVLLNAGQADFIDVSHLTTADLESDSRGVVIADFNQDGMQDVIVRSVGGGPVRMFLNRFPQKRWLKVSLRGSRSNSLGLGARVCVEAGSQKIWQTVYPVSSYQSQMPTTLTFGLGDATSVSTVTVHWPSGLVQNIHDMPIDRHVTIHEDADWQLFADTVAP